jgi:type IV pilus assembly protein PilB
VTRLAKMGIESFLTASAVDCVVAQRLARKLCSNCKQRAAIPKKVLEESGFKVRAAIEAYEPVGCSRCNKTGYKGRTGIFSVMVVSDTIKDMVVNLAPESEIAKQAAAEGMLTLREDGLAKVRTGLTSIEEVVRVTS